MARSREAGRTGTSGRRRKDEAGKPSFKPEALDKLIHERRRLGIMSALAVNDRMSFQELKDALDATDGNLSVHARKLEEAGYLACAKSFDGRVPRTDYNITRAGRTALEGYLAHMERIIRSARG